MSFPTPRPSTPGEPAPGVAVVTLDRPEALNALSYALLEELVHALETLDGDEDCRAIVLTGSGSRAFAAGADIKELSSASPVSLLLENRFALWERLRQVRTPLIAAVRGVALGGGCELAMACDMIVAAEDARFGQPEIGLGIMPGAGGTQRLTRAIGKAKAMDLILTGRAIDAREADRLGLVTRVVPAEETLQRAVELAEEVAAMPRLAVIAAKDAVGRAFELGLSAGLEFERRTFFLLFASEDQKEGMDAFVSKRTPTWKGR
ncbi:MAG TPA: enoyl-CoA hydratase-related protein [Candidatus Limnocylindrales bacterium]